jgi:hypothetical protein
MNTKRLLRERIWLNAALNIWEIEPHFHSAEVRASTQTGSAAGSGFVAAASHFRRALFFCRPAHYQAAPQTAKVNLAEPCVLTHFD